MTFFLRRYSTADSEFRGHGSTPRPPKLQWPRKVNQYKFIKGIRSAVSVTSQIYKRYDTSWRHSYGYDTKSFLKMPIVSTPNDYGIRLMPYWYGKIDSCFAYGLVWNDWNDDYWYVSKNCVVACFRTSGTPKLVPPPPFFDVGFGDEPNRIT